MLGIRRAFVFVPFGVLLAGCGQPSPPPFKPIADTKLLMNAVIDPAADHIWDAVATFITVEGTEEIAPHTEEEWTAVRNSALTLAESGNLLMMVPRAKNADDWMLKAKALVDAGEAAMRAADAKNAETLFTIGGQVYESCTSCHSTYMEAIVAVK